jgi:hypothetical protein
MSFSFFVIPTRERSDREESAIGRQFRGAIQESRFLAQKPRFGMTTKLKSSVQTASNTRPQQLSTGNCAFHPVN